MVDLVSDGSDGSETVESGRPCSFVGEGGAAEGSVRPKRTISAVGAKSKEHRTGSKTKAHSKKANAASASVEADVDSDDEPRYRRLNSVGAGRPLVEFAAGYEMVTNQVQLKAGYAGRGDSVRA